MQEQIVDELAQLIEQMEAAKQSAVGLPIQDAPLGFAG